MSRSMGRFGKGGHMCGSCGNLRDNIGGTVVKLGRGRVGMVLGRVVGMCRMGAGCAGIGPGGSGRFGGLFARRRMDSDTGIDVGYVGAASVVSATRFVGVRVEAGGDVTLVALMPGVTVLHDVGICTGTYTGGAVATVYGACGVGNVVASTADDTVVVAAHDPMAGAVQVPSVCASVGDAGDVEGEWVFVFCCLCLSWWRLLCFLYSLCFGARRGDDEVDVVEVVLEEE